MPITINGSGTVTGITAGGLPDGVITTDDIAASAITRAKMGYAGAILQVVQTIKTDQFSTTTGTTYVDIAGMSATITPLNSSSKILVLVDMKVGITNSGNNARVKLVRNSSDIYAGTDTRSPIVGPVGFQQIEMSQYGAAATYSITPMVAIFMDSPSSSASITYKLQVSRANGIGSFYVNRNDSYSTDQIVTSSTMTLLEVAA